MEVGQVIQFYDSDRRFPAWGFGGKVPNGSVSHCFNLNGTPSDFEVNMLPNISCFYFIYQIFVSKKKRSYIFLK